MKASTLNASAQHAHNLRGLCLGLVTGMFAFALPSQAAVLDVCASGCSYSSIQTAVSSAAAGDTIELAPETFNQGGIYIDKNLTLRSATGRAKINAGNQSYVFFIDQGVTVRLEDLTLRGGTQARIDNRGQSYLSSVFVLGTGAANPSLYGGIVNQAGADLTLKDASLVAGNASQFHGGGVTNYGDLIVLGSTVMSNTGVDGGGVSNNGGTVSVLTSSFSFNTATDQGGAWANLSGTFAFHSSSSYSGNSAAVSCDKYWNPGASPSCVN